MNVMRRKFSPLLLSLGGKAYNANFQTYQTWFHHVRIPQALRNDLPVIHKQWNITLEITNPVHRGYMIYSPSTAPRATPRGSTR